MGGSGTTQTSNQSSQTQLPPWVSNAAQQNYALAQNVAGRPLQQYQGQQVAGVAPQQQQSWDLAASMPGANAAPYNEANAGYLGVLGQGAPQVQAGALANTNLSPYMNPFTQSVINTTLPLMQQQNALSQNQQANAANSANAFGGSRQGVQQGVAQAQGALNIGNMASGLNQANFTQAQAGATGDLNRQLTAAQGNQGAQIQNTQNQIAKYKRRISANMLANSRRITPGISSNSSWTECSRHLRARFSNRLAFQRNMEPLPTSGVELPDHPERITPALAGMDSLLASSCNHFPEPRITFQTLTDWMRDVAMLKPTDGTAYTSSDREEKTDIKKLGKQGGLDMYAYRYKGDPKTYPKVGLFNGPRTLRSRIRAYKRDFAGSKAIAPGAGARPFALAVDDAK